MFRSRRAKQLDRRWSAVSKDPKLKSADLAALLDGASKDDLGSLIKETIEERKKEQSWLKRHWLEFLLIAALVAIAGLIVWNLFWVVAAKGTKHVVVAARNIPAFHKLQKDDLSLGPSDSDGFNNSAMLVDRYTISPIETGSIVRQRQLAPLDWGRADVRLSWRIITAPVKGPAGPLARFDMPGQVIMVMASRSEKMPSEVFDAWLLEYPLKDDPGSALFAIHAGDVKRFAAVAGQSDLFLARDVK